MQFTGQDDILSQYNSWRATENELIDQLIKRKANMKYTLFHKTCWIATDNMNYLFHQHAS